MSLTRSTLFETYAETSGHQRDLILAVTQQGTTYYFSTRPMPEGINSSPIYPIMLSHRSLTEGINIFTKQWKISDINFVLSDEPFYPQSGSTPIRVSELLEGLNGETVKLYQWVDGITDIADCLLIFDGHSLQSLQIDKHTARFTAKDRSKLWDIELPTRTIGSVWAEAPNNNLNRPIPILYGSFSVPDVYDDAITTATGLVCSWAYETVSNGEYVISDHAINAVGSPFRNAGGPTVIPVSLLNSDDDDGGIAWIKASQLGVLEFFPSATLPNVYVDETYFESQSDRDNLSDNDISTICNFQDRLSDDGDFAEGLSLFGIEHESVLRQHLLNHGEVNLGYKLINASNWPVGEIHRLSFFLYYGTDGVTDERASIGDTSDTGISGTSPFVYNSPFFQYPGDESHHADAMDVHSDVPGEAWAIGVYISAGVIGSSNSDSIVDNATILTMADAVLRYHITFPFQDHVFVNANGKEYGNDIVDGVRDNPFNQFATNEDPCYIIESMYRDYIGLTDSDIDTDSFDSAVNTDVESRISIVEFTKLSKIVQQLSEQSTFVLAASGAGKLRCIPLNDPSPTIATTIRRSQLVDDNFSLSKTNFIINDMDVQSRWQSEFERFLEFVNYSDASSKTEVQVRRASFGWKNILGSSAEHVAEHYVEEDFGIWSNEHIQVRFSTAGFTHSHLQPGDWIKFDPDIDDLKKAFGSSWTDRELLVIETQKGMDGTEIAAIELYGNGFPVSSPEPSPSPDPSPSPGNPSLSPSDTAPYGRYIQDPIASPKALPLLYTLTDGDTTTEVVTDSGYMAKHDHYGLEFDSVVTPDTGITFFFNLDRALTGSPQLQHGECRIYYSNDNNSWTQWGTQRTHTNGGMTGFAKVIRVHGDGSPSVSALFWKVKFDETPGDASTVGATELTMNTI